MEIKSLVVIPTRNRTDLAKNAIRSVLDQSDCKFEVIVSDNSTDEAQVSELRKFCKVLADNRLSYVRPEPTLTMTKHWDWVMKTVLEKYEFSHITFLTDRMVFKKDALKQLESISGRFPDKLITYAIDEILDQTDPVTLLQNSTTKKLFEITNDEMVKAFLELLWVSPFPRMFNCYVPRSFIEQVHKEYGEIFSSVSPDFNFGFKVMDLEDSTLYYDEALLVSYGLKVSNGQNMLTGTWATNETAIDFHKQIDQSDVYIDCLLPFCSTAIDALLNEYFYIVKRGKRRKFPPLNKSKYRSRVISNVLQLPPSNVRSQLIGILQKEYGKRYPEFVLRSKLPLKRYGLRLISDASTTIFAKEGAVRMEFESIDKALEYLINSRAFKSRSRASFYKRTSILPLKLNELKF